MKELQYKLNFIKKLKIFKENLTVFIKEDYDKLLNLCIEFDNNSYGIPYLVDYIYDQDFINEDESLIYIKEQVDDLARLRCFINSTYNDEIYCIDGYGNLNNVSQKAIANLCEELIDILQENINELKQAEL